ncbi:MAG TPA: hypothetical protein VND22_06965, partial [Actinomycetota bacterium]|nr:hypothetical protein [Actinomycetota bacterium]
AAAKGLDEMAKKYPALVIKGGILDGKVFGPDQAQALAKIEPREVLLAKLAGMLQAPLQSVANLLSAPLRQLGYVLGAYQDKLNQEVPAEVPAEGTTSEPEAAGEPQEAEPAKDEKPGPEVNEATAEASDATESKAEATSDDEVASEPPAAASEAVGDTSGESGSEAAPAPRESEETSEATQQPVNGNDQES